MKCGGLIMPSSVKTQNANLDAVMSPQVAKPYIVDMLEQLMLLAHGSNLRHIANGLDDLLEPYRE